MKQVILFLLCLCLALPAAGCSVKKLNTEKLKDIEFTVLEEENIPEELKAKIKENEKQPFKLTYADNGALYIAQGYGPQKSSGYSIIVKECYETNNAIYVHMNLIGPTKEEKIVETETYPYLVIKMEFIDKVVVFQ